MNVLGVGLELSDVTLLLDFVLAVFLMLYFAFGQPRTWHKDRLGWVIFGYAVVTVAFIGLIAYAIIFDQKVIEPVRFVIGLLMAGALSAKIWAVYRERRAARLESVFTRPKEGSHERRN